MTKKERKVTQDFINTISHWQEMADSAFDFLKEKNKEINGNAWCSAEINYKELLAAGYDFTSQYEAYAKGQGIRYAISTYGQELANIGFWK